MNNDLFRFLRTIMQAVDDESVQYKISNLAPV